MWISGGDTFSLSVFTTAGATFASVFGVTTAVGAFVLVVAAGGATTHILGFDIEDGATMNAFGAVTVLVVGIST